MEARQAPEVDRGGLEQVIREPDRAGRERLQQTRSLGRVVASGGLTAGPPGSGSLHALAEIDQHAHLLIDMRCVLTAGEQGLYALGLLTE